MKDNLLILLISSGLILWMLYMLISEFIKQLSGG